MVTDALTKIGRLLIETKQSYDLRLGEFQDMITSGYVDQNPEKQRKQIEDDLIAIDRAFKTLLDTHDRYMELRKEYEDRISKKG